MQNHGEENSQAMGKAPTFGCNSALLFGFLCQGKKKQKYAAGLRFFYVQFFTVIS